jgi:Tol biopolymer transport system component
MKLRSKAAAVCIVVIAAAALAVAVTRAAASRTSSSPANGQLAWDPCPLEDPCAPGKVVIANPDGSAKRTLHLPWGSDHPVWSPDGSRLLITAHRPNLPDRPATMNPDGSILTLLGPAGVNLDLWCRSWSPDGTKLLCGGSNQTGTLNGIYTVRSSDGGDLTRLTASPNGYYDATPEYSPEGTRFAFVRATDDDKTGALFVENANGTGLHQITAYGLPTPGDYAGLAWSPDGTEIIFSDAAHWSLDTIHPDGTALHELIRGNSGCPCFFSPTWSPDGTHIAYADNRNLTFSDVYTAKADGTGRVDITKTLGAGEGWPSWGTHSLAPKCTAAEKTRRARAISTFKRRMTAARRAYFRTHQGAQARAAFVKAQRTKLKRLERSAAACANRNLSAFGPGSPGWDLLDPWLQSAILNGWATTSSARVLAESKDQR